MTKIAILAAMAVLGLSAAMPVTAPAAEPAAEGIMKYAINKPSVAWNVYGPGQSLKNPYTGILSIFSTLIRRGKEINIFEDGEESRDFVYIDDVVEATYLASIAPGISGRVINVGSGVATTVTDVVDALLRAFGTDVAVTVSGRFRVGDIRHNIADTTRSRELLGFEARVPFDQGIERYVRWVQSEPLEEDEYERSLAEMAVRNLLK